MRFEILPSATKHSITDAEIRTAIAYPVLRITLKPRRYDIATLPVLHIGRIDNQPHIEVIADLYDPDVAIVFHAMMLRPALVDSLGLAVYFTPEFGPQRP